MIDWIVISKQCQFKFWIAPEKLREDPIKQDIQAALRSSSVYQPFAKLLTQIHLGKPEEIDPISGCVNSILRQPIDVKVLFPHPLTDRDHFVYIPADRTIRPCLPTLCKIMAPEQIELVRSARDKRLGGPLHDQHIPRSPFKIFLEPCEMVISYTVVHTWNITVGERFDVVAKPSEFPAQTDPCCLTVVDNNTVCSEIVTIFNLHIVDIFVLGQSLHFYHGMISNWYLLFFTSTPYLLLYSHQGSNKLLRTALTAILRIIYTRISYPSLVFGKRSPVFLREFTTHLR